MVVTDNFDCVQSAGPSVLSQFYLTERPNTNILHQLELIYALKIPFRADFYFRHIPFLYNYANNRRSPRGHFDLQSSLGENMVELAS